ncbi:MAG: 1-deoxy-D-xylulose-5-phosphate synthase, partial [Deltaproteobacteria bacterium]|nr:1-deoxy-D-xylulose-5-phosphate synthase [Deltaproteobacteria bacterium]
NKVHIDVVLVGIGITVGWAMKAAENLQKQGVNALVVNARFVKPLDADLFKRVARLCPKILTVEENVRMCGFGSSVLEFYEQENLLSQIHIKCLGIPDQFYEQATQAKLQSVAGIDTDSIIKTAKEMLAADEALTQKNIQQKSAF